MLGCFFFELNRDKYRQSLFLKQKTLLGCES